MTDLPEFAPLETPSLETPVPALSPEPSAAPSLMQRVARRVLRRPSNWLNSPWPIERVVQYLTALIVVGGCTLAVIQVCHYDLVFSNNTPTGGDMGAHVMAPAYLRDSLLPHFQDRKSTRLNSSH